MHGREAMLNILGAFCTDLRFLINSREATHSRRNRGRTYLGCLRDKPMERLL
jgi:hypothetical protein